MKTVVIVAIAFVLLLAASAYAQSGYYVIYGYFPGRIIDGPYRAYSDCQDAIKWIARVYNYNQFELRCEYRFE